MYHSDEISNYIYSTDYKLEEITNCLNIATSFQLSRLISKINPKFLLLHFSCFINFEVETLKYGEIIFVII